MLSVELEAATLGVTANELLGLSRYVEMGDKVSPLRKRMLIAAEGLALPAAITTLVKKLKVKAHAVLVEHRKGFDWTKGPFMPEKVASEPDEYASAPTRLEYDCCILREWFHLHGRVVEFEDRRKAYHLPSEGLRWSTYARQWRIEARGDLEAEAVRIIAEGEARAIKRATYARELAIFRARGTSARAAVALRHDEKLVELREMLESWRETVH